MSDSEVDTPSAATISRAFRDVVAGIYEAGNTDELTVKRVRTKAEEKLGLPNGFFKQDEWKQKSNDMIHEAVDEHCVDEPSQEPQAAPPKKAPKKPKPEPKKKAKPAGDGTRGVKRKAATPAKKPQKRRKAVVSSDSESGAGSAHSDAQDKEEPLSEAESEPTGTLARRQKKVVTEDSDDEAAPQAEAKDKETKSAEEEETVPAVKEQIPVPEAKGDDSDSDLSSLIDEPPVKKKRQKKEPAVKGGKERKPKAAKATKAKATKSKDEDDPDQAEIKRLQGWLVKCGIRKVWGKELAKCDTSKDKIKHLKNLLKDAGMEGKYSNEKAARIKEQREFARDLEEIQAGALAWGKEEAAPSERPRRRLTRPAQKAVVPDEDDEDEDDAHEDKEESAEDDDDEVKADSMSEEADEGDDSD